jgi:hypothetical protein
VRSIGYADINSVLLADLIKICAIVLPFLIIYRLGFVDFPCLARVNASTVVDERISDKDSFFHNITSKNIIAFSRKKVNKNSCAIAKNVVK